MSVAKLSPKQIMTLWARTALRAFLDSGSVLRMPRPAVPRLSVLLILYNRAELTLACLQSLLSGPGQVPFEVVVVDNASTDETTRLLERVEGLEVIRNPRNVGFPEAVNQAAERARGEFLLLLNNDTQVLGRSIDTAVEFLAANADVGAVGGRIILLDGSLEEAGCGLWPDGRPLQYGRGDDPFAPQYLFRRDVDCCCGAFLMTRRALFARLGGLDLAFAPAYLEDTDYCVRLWRAGWRVVYLPGVAVLHYENASSESRGGPADLSHRSHLLFTAKHAEWLCLQCSPAQAPELWLRSSHDDRLRILYLLDTRPQAGPPDPSLRPERLVAEMVALDYFVTVYPVGPGLGDDRGPGPRLPEVVEVLAGGEPDSLPDFLASRRGYYDLVFVTDEGLLGHVRRSAEPGLRVIYRTGPKIDLTPASAANDLTVPAAGKAADGVPNWTDPIGRPCGV
jgi:GT2 family glycosyltransferase